MRLRAQLLAGLLAVGCGSPEFEPVEEPIVRWCLAWSVPAVVDGTPMGIKMPGGGSPRVCRCASFSDFEDHDVRADVAYAWYDYCLELAEQAAAEEHACDEKLEKTLAWGRMWEEGECEQSFYSP